MLLYKPGYYITGESALSAVYITTDTTHLISVVTAGGGAKAHRDAFLSVTLSDQTGISAA